MFASHTKIVDSQFGACFTSFEHIRVASLVWSGPARQIRSHLFVDSDHTGASQAQIVLQSDLGILYLPLLRHISQLPAKFGTLRQTSGSERMALTDKTPTRIDHHFAAIGELIPVNALASFALSAQTKRFVGDQFVRRETIVKFDNVNLIGRYTRLSVSLLSRTF